MQAEIAFARHGHAQGAVAEHLDAHGLAVGAAYVVAPDGVGNGLDLGEIELARKHNHIGPPGIEFHRLDVRDALLCGDVHLHADAAGIGYGSNVAGDDGRDAALRHGVDDGVAFGDVLVIDDGVDGEVGFHSGLVADGGNFAQVVEGEVHTRAGTHVEAFHAEIYGVGTGVDGRMQTFVAPHWSHYFKIGTFHSVRAANLLLSAAKLHKKSLFLPLWRCDVGLTAHMAAGEAECQL